MGMSVNRSNARSYAAVPVGDPKPWGHALLVIAAASVALYLVPLPPTCAFAAVQALLLSASWKHVEQRALHLPENCAVTNSATPQRYPLPTDHALPAQGPVRQ
jgi:hypothetical protein